MIGLLMEGAVRALLVAGVVGAGLRLLRVRNVPAEKAAWGLVLAAAVAMPLLTAAGARWQLLPAGATVRIPVELVNMLPWRAENPEPMMRVENEAAAAAQTRGSSLSHPFRTERGKDGAPIFRTRTRPVTDGFVLSQVHRIAGPGAPIFRASSRTVLDRLSVSQVPESEGPPPHGQGPVGGDPGPGAPTIQSVQTESMAMAAAPMERSDAGVAGAGAGERFPAPVISNRDETPRVALAQAGAQGAWLKNAGWLAWAVYLGVALLLLARLLLGLGSALRIWRNAEPVPDAMAERFATGLSLRWSNAVATPVTIGGGVLLPEEYTDWDEEKLRVVVAHEASHVRQGDFYLQMLAGAYAAAIWISPLGW